MAAPAELTENVGEDLLIFEARPPQPETIDAGTLLFEIAADHDPTSDHRQE